MWISASDRKPNNTRRVLIRTNTDFIYFSRWHETTWSYTGDPVIYWMEIDDLLKLPILDMPTESTKIDVPVPEPTIEEYSKWYVSPENITRLKALGYTVRHPFANEYWPLSYKGMNLKTIPCRYDMEAWYWCWLDYKRTQSNTEGLK